MIRQRLQGSRQQFHVQIRRQDFDDSLKRKRNCFIMATCAKVREERKSQLVQQLSSISQSLKSNSEHILDLIKRIKHEQVKIVQCPQIVNKMIEITLSLLEDPDSSIDKDLLKVIIEQVTELLANLLSFEDHEVLPHLEGILKLMKHHQFMSLMYKISIIRHWDNKLELRSAFIELFLSYVGKKIICEEYDVGVINGFCQLKLKPHIYFQFISLINAFLGCNMTDVISICGLIDAFDSLRRIARFSSQQYVAVEIVQCNFITKETIKLLERSKSPQLLKTISNFLGELFGSSEAAANFLERQCSLFPLLLQLLLKPKLSQDVKQLMCFNISQLATTPDVANEFYEEILSRLVYLHQTYATSQKIMEQIQYIYLTMMTRVDYERALDALKRQPGLLLLCMDSLKFDIKNRTLIMLETVLSKQVSAYDTQQQGLASTVLLARFNIEEYLQGIQQSQVFQLSQAATHILQTYLDSMEVEFI